MHRFITHLGDREHRDVACFAAPDYARHDPGRSETETCCRRGTVTGWDEYDKQHRDTHSSTPIPANPAPML